jgi:hypothetical protein
LRDIFLFVIKLFNSFSLTKIFVLLFKVVGNERVVVVKIKCKKGQEKRSDLPKVTLILEELEEDELLLPDPPQEIPPTRVRNDRDKGFVIYEYNLHPRGKYSVIYRGKKIPIIVPEVSNKENDIELSL